MGTTDANESWMKIQQGAKDAERLISQRQYNMAMIRSRQTLEYMVKCLSSKALIVEGDLADVIDQLYEGQWITKQSHERYHRIRIIGNKAVHEANNSAADADQAYHFLVQEIHTFANEYSKISPRRRPQQSQARSQAPVRAQAQTRNSQRAPERSARPPIRSQGGSASRGRKRSKKSGFNPYDLLKPTIILIIILILVALIRFLLPDGDEEKTPETTPTATTVAPTPATTAPPETTEPETTEAPVVYKVKGDNVNVRSAPSTEGDTKVGTLNNGTVVDYVGTYDQKWSIINYNNQQAFIATEFLTSE